MGRSFYDGGFYRIREDGRRPGGRVPFSPAAETSTLLAAMSTQPSAARKGLIDQTVRNLIAAGVWAKLDALYVLAAHTNQAALLNWRAPGTSDATEQANGGTLTFTVDRGYTGDGAASYINSNFNPGDGGSYKFLQDDAHLGVFIGTNVSAGAQNDIATTRNGIISRSGSNALHRSQSTSSDTGSAVTVSTGHHLWTRSAAAQFTTYWNAGAADTNTRTSAAIISEAFFILARNGSGTPSNFSTRQVSAASIGGALTAGEISSLYSALRLYMLGVGAPV